MLRIAMVSGWHVHAKGYAAALQNMPDVQITAVYDEDPDRGRAWAAELGAPFEADLAALLRREDVDAVCVNSPTNRHPEVMVAAAKAKKHVFTEKVMALTVKECDEIAAAVRQAGVRFGISFPQRCTPHTLFAKKAAEDGLLGRITFMRVRVAHNGACAGWLPPHFWEPGACGGGAMMDLGAHPMYLIRWIMGQPKRISSTFTHMTGREVEDNSVSVIEFEGGAIAASETSFMSTHSPFSLELSGTEGSLVIGGPDGACRLRANAMQPPFDGWVAPARLPEALPSPLRQWVTGILEDKPIPFGLEEGTQLTELMEFAYVAYREKRQVEIPPR